MSNLAPRRALFIDGSNLYAAAKTLGFDIDYRKLRQFFEGGAWLLRSYYYTAIADDQDYSPVRPLADWLDYNGFYLVSKPAKEYTDAMGRRASAAAWTSRSRWTPSASPTRSTTWC